MNFPYPLQTFLAGAAPRGSHPSKEAAVGLVYLNILAESCNFPTEESAP